MLIIVCWYSIECIKPFLAIYFVLRIKFIKFFSNNIKFKITKIGDFKTQVF